MTGREKQTEHKSRKNVRRAGAIASAVSLGGLAVGVRMRRAAHSRLPDSYIDEDFGLIDRDRASEVQTDDGITLAVREVGPREAALTVVFVHGFTNRMTSFHLQRRELHARWGASVRMVFFDLRGHGKSSTPAAGSYTIERLGQDLCEVIDAVVPRGPIVLVGHSMGGMSVLAAARQRPRLFHDRVVGVGLLSSTAAGLASEGLGRSLRHPLIDGFAYAARSTPKLLEHSRVVGRRVMWAIVHAASYRSHVSPTLVAFTNAMIDETPVGTIGGFLRALEHHDELEALPVLVDIPVLILSGTDDVVIPFSGAVRMAGELPNSELVRVDGAGHMVHMEFPDIVDDAIDRLVQRAQTWESGSESVG